MPLVILCGRPSSGKSTVAHLIQEQCSSSGVECEIVTETTIQLDKNECYKNAYNEKMALGALRSEIERRLHTTRVLVFDSLNLIKGYRYEIWCLARGAGTRCCLINVETPVDACREWNSGRAAEEAYHDDVFEDLASRMERPDSRRRWEAPLYNVNPSSDKEIVIRVCEEVAHYSNAKASFSRKTTVEDYDMIAPPKVFDLQPTMATNKTELSQTNMLHDIDKELQTVLKDIIQAQTDAGGSAPGIIRFGEDMPILNATRPVTVAELRRYKRMFLKMVTNNTFQRNFESASQLRPLFIQYVSDQVHA
jgi:protein KTI12